MYDSKLTYPSIDLDSMCIGIFLCHAFLSRSGQPVVGRPPLAEVLRIPDVAHRRLSELGVDSLAWMEALTTLEADLHILIGDELLAESDMSSWIIAQAIARALSTKSPTSGGTDKLVV